MASRRLLPLAIGTLLVLTLPIDIGLLIVNKRVQPSQRPANSLDRYVASARTSAVPHTVGARPTGRITPHLLIAGRATISTTTLDQIRGLKGVKAMEVVDAAQVPVAGKIVGVLGVDPASFRAYTPQPTADSDPLWRNIAAGDIAVSFVLGQDGGLRLGSVASAGPASRPRAVRIGAYATMGLDAVDAVVSRDQARELGLPHGNALLVSAPRTDLTKLTRRLQPALPHGTKAVIVDPRMAVAGPRRDSRVMSPEQIQAAIREAQKQIGVPYVWGGESLAEGGFDCSGLVQWAFARVGVRMPRVAVDQAKTGPRLPFDQARPGDLLFWTNDPTAPGYISHEAIYLGGDKMLVAPHTGDVVKIQTVYLRNFWGAVRVDPRLSARLADHP